MGERYYVYYDYGYCSDGDHRTGLDEFDTPQLARARADELDAEHGTHDGAAEVFAGRPISRRADPPFRGILAGDK